MAKIYNPFQHFHSPEEFEEYLKKLGVDVEEENKLDQVIGEYNSNFPTNLCPHCKAPLPEHQVTIVRGLVVPCPLTLSL